MDTVQGVGRFLFLLLRAAGWPCVRVEEDARPATQLRPQRVPPAALDLAEYTLE